MLLSKLKNTFLRSSLVYQPSKAFAFKRTTTYLPKPGDGKIKQITLIPGEGIGSELCESVLEIFSHLEVPIQWDIIKKFSFDNPVSLQQLRKNKTILKGPVTDKIDSSVLDNLHFSRSLDLYTHIVHAFSMPGIKVRHSGIDIVVIRENSEGEYSNIEHEVYPGVIESIKLVTKQASLKIAEYAFEYAYLSDRRKVTVVHKANIMKLCDGQFLEASREVAKRYPSIKYEEMIIDNCCMQLTLHPQQFDVMLMPNLYGAIVSNIVAGITGGAGLAPGANIGQEYALFETVPLNGTRHSGRDIAGKGIANPTAFILSSIMMLRHVGLPYFADMIQEGVFLTLEDQQIRTPDIGGSSTTTEFTKEIIKNIEELQETKAKRFKK